MRMLSRISRIKVKAQLNPNPCPTLFHYHALLLLLMAKLIDRGELPCRPSSLWLHFLPGEFPPWDIYSPW